MSGMERFKKQVSASCKRLRFSAESMVSHLERNLLPIFLFLFYTFFFAQIKRKKKFLNTDNFSLHLSLTRWLLWTTLCALSLSWGLLCFCFDGNVHFFCMQFVFCGSCDLVAGDFAIYFENIKFRTFKSHCLKSKTFSARNWTCLLRIIEVKDLWMIVFPFSFNEPKIVAQLWSQIVDQHYTIQNSQSLTKNIATIHQQITSPSQLIITIPFLHLVSTHHKYKWFTHSFKERNI